MRLGKAALLGAVAVAAGFVATTSIATTAWAQNEQYLAGLIYRTGAYAPNGIPFANGIADYYALINARDGGINGVKLNYEECDTGYATDRGVECYERLKNKGPTGTAYVAPLSTGITFALTEKAPIDKIPIISMGYGRSESRDGSVFQWNFPLLGTYWSAADIIMQHIAKKEGGFDKLKGKKIVLVYHDSPYGKEPIALLEERAKMHGFSFTPMPVTHPGVEQKATWLQIRQNRPDYVLLWGWGVMNSTSIKEAAAVGFPRDKMYGVWWSGAEPDVRPAEDGAKGYNAAMLQHGAGQFAVHNDLKKYLYDKGLGSAKWDETGEVLYIRGLVNGMLGVESIRKAQTKFGNKPLTGEQVRWGIENLEISAARIKELGFEGVLQPLKVSCSDHEGTRAGRIQQWDGKKWNVISEWYESDDKVLKPMVAAAAKKYADEKKLAIRDCSKES
ncbi:ABC transporter substrate-binding protein [Reyranella sp.]|uniref:ABC transporter substrate-binding protein n=1 Tax=Reyranella sp. TaxID=1929291 RepID=UPI00120E2669|nr:ABC transporter substrate-binding protein [Reyranella sp.]TAJ81896.1 MAG: ABC transporter permease [Reyranella sp.]